MKRLNIKVFSREKFDYLLDCLDRRQDIEQQILVEGYAGIPASEPVLVPYVKGEEGVSGEMGEMGDKGADVANCKEC